MSCKSGDDIVSYYLPNTIIDLTYDYLIDFKICCN